MVRARQDDHHVPAKITDAAFEPVSNLEPVWEAPHHDEPSRLPLSFTGRMFNVGWKGWTRLAIICVTVGAIFQAGGFNPFVKGFNIGEGFGQIIYGVLNIASWAAQNGGLPLALGAIAVLPFWLLWRAIVTLANRDKGPSPEDRILPRERKRKPHQL